MTKGKTDVAQLQFYGGVGSIGSSKVLVEQDGWRAFFDLGPLIPGRDGLLREPVEVPAARQLLAQVALGEAPAIEHLYRPGALGDGKLAMGGDGRTALFVTHCHIDHMGLLGWVDPSVPIYASEETVRMVRALEAAGLGLPGGAPQLRALAEGEAVAVGTMTVERYAVDHDVPGASGYLVHCDDGVVAYTGDLRLHGRHPQLSEFFARRAAGATALVIEGTTLSGTPRYAPRSEADVDAAFDRALAQAPGLVVMSVYPRDVERVEAFLAIAAARRRRVYWPTSTAAFLRAYGVQGVVAAEGDWAGQVRSAPDESVVQLDLKRVDQLLDLPTGPGSVFVHANGEPLGPFQPSWDVLQDWLSRLQIPFVSIGTSGHASPGDIHRLVEMVSPGSVYPLHTADPYRLLPPPGTVRVLPEYGRSYSLGARAVQARSRVASTGAAAAGDARATVCVDLDSTLADTRHRHHMVDPEDRERTDWVAYSLACAADAPIEGACGLVRMLAQTYRVVIVSSRDEKARSLTEAWLAEHDVPYDELVLGGDGSAPADLGEFKVHHVQRLLERGDRVVLVVDDLPVLPVAMAKAGLGVPVLTVRPPYS